MPTGIALPRGGSILGCSSQIDCFFVSGSNFRIEPAVASEIRTKGYIRVVFFATWKVAILIRYCASRISTSLFNLMLSPVPSHGLKLMRYSEYIPGAGMDCGKTWRFEVMTRQLSWPRSAMPPQACSSKVCRTRCNSLLSLILESSFAFGRML
jgi:hypothetical protein